MPLYVNKFAKFNVDVSGLNMLAGDSTVNTLGALLYVEAEKIMTDSKENYVPVGLRWWGHRPGNLRDSGTVQPPRFGPSGVSVTLGYDMQKAPYAWIVHERDPSIGQGKTKYLERPMVIASATISARVQAALNARLGTVLSGRGVSKNAWSELARA